MSLFIAINFDELIKDSLNTLIGELKANGVTGNFTVRDNFHLTLNFIGETGRVNEIKKVMDKIDVGSFNMRLNGLGLFKRDFGDILWIGIQSDPELYTLHKQLNDGLIKQDFKMENRRYKPHLTLGRKVTFPENFHLSDFKVPEIHVGVKSIQLMKSERIHGNLVYTSIYEKLLNAD